MQKKVVKLSNRPDWKHVDILCLNPGCHFVHSKRIKDVSNERCDKCKSINVVAIKGSTAIEFPPGLERIKLRAAE